MAAEEKDILHEHLRGSRAAMLDKLEGIGDYDRRRPLVPTGTNLLGLVKHLAGLEYGYLGSCFGREPAEPMPWTEDEIWGGADMWATADETSEYLIGFYRRGCEHADRTIEELDLDTVGEVPWWPEERRQATLRRLLVRMDATGKRVVVPVPDSSVEERPLMDFTPGYVLRALDRLPKQGDREPWRLRQSYTHDRRTLAQPLDDGVLRFS